MWFIYKRHRFYFWKYLDDILPFSYYPDFPFYFSENCSTNIPFHIFASYNSGITWLYIFASVLSMMFTIITILTSIKWILLMTFSPRYTLFGLRMSLALFFSFGYSCHCRFLINLLIEHCNWFKKNQIYVLQNMDGW